jgi:uncharacterized protein (TIGR03435 family)
MRRETKEVPAYVITVAKGGPRLEKSNLTEDFCATTPESFAEADSCHAFNGGQGRGLHGVAVDLSDLAYFVEAGADRPVVDRTGIKGLYNIQTEGWVPLRPRPPRPPGTEPSAEDLAFADPTRPTIFAIFERLGLKLEAQKAAVETFVIESVMVTQLPVWAEVMPETCQFPTIWLKTPVAFPPNFLPCPKGNS